jgi:peptide/nickel transport system permease protein
VIYPLLSPYSPTEPDFTQPTFADPSWSHPLGTDNFGRDTLTRLAYGGRVDLVIALAATLVTLVVGSALGLLSGYVGGWFDSLLMRLVDFTLTIPYLILVIAIVAILGTGTWNIVYAIWLVGWVAYARIIRAETLVARKLEYVEAARVIGMSQLRIMLRHIVPNVISAALIFAMADMVLNILVSSSLSFLGLGVQPPNPEWGLMVAEARDFFLRDWRLMTYPGLAVLIIGAGFGLIGDGLAQALRPKG